jgi:hypothetical protein
MNHLGGFARTHARAACGFRTFDSGGTQNQRPLAYAANDRIFRCAYLRTSRVAIHFVSDPAAIVASAYSGRCHSAWPNL